MNTLLLSAKDLYKEYKSGEGICIAVNHVDFHIEEGDFITIVGASGSGKSTLLYLLSGMVDMTSGEVSYLGKNFSVMPDKQKAEYRGKNIGFVFQEGNLLYDLTVLKNVALPGYLYGNRKVVEQSAAEWLDELGLMDQKKKYPNELSGGQKQRTAIARALINHPKILFLDEPTGSLDAVNGEALLNLLVRLNQKGQSIVMVTHDMGAAARGSKVIMIQDGAVRKTLLLGKYENNMLEERKAKLHDAALEEK